MYHSLCLRKKSKANHTYEAGKNSFFQSTQNPDYYYNNKSKCWFYHDLTKFADFDSQYCVVRCKYEKRIRRFYNAISKPTIFLRYIDNQADADFINRNEQDILNFLQSFCPDNKLYYIYNDNLFCTAQNSFAVKIDENDTVARNFFTQLPLLEKNLKSNYYDKSLIAYNSKRYMKSQNIGRKIVKKIKKIFSNYFVIHTFMTGKSKNEYKNILWYISEMNVKKGGGCDCSPEH